MAFINPQENPISTSRINFKTRGAIFDPNSNLAFVILGIVAVAAMVWFADLTGSIFSSSTYHRNVELLFGIEISKDSSWMYLLYALDLALLLIAIFCFWQLSYGGFGNSLKLIVAKFTIVNLHQEGRWTVLDAETDEGTWRLVCFPPRDVPNSFPASTAGVIMFFNYLRGPRVAIINNRYYYPKKYAFLGPKISGQNH